MTEYWSNIKRVISSEIFFKDIVLQKFFFEVKFLNMNDLSRHITFGRRFLSKKKIFFTDSKFV